MSKPRIVHDLNFPEGFSVNDGISNNVFEMTPSNYVYRGVDRLIELSEKGKGCHSFKTDLLRAFRQTLVNPDGISLLGFQVNDLLYFYVVLYWPILALLSFWTLSVMKLMPRSVTACLN